MKKISEKTRSRWLRIFNVLMLIVYPVIFWILTVAFEYFSHPVGSVVFTVIGKIICVVIVIVEIGIIFAILNMVLFLIFDIRNSDTDN